MRENVGELADWDDLFRILSDFALDQHQKGTCQGRSIEDEIAAGEQAVDKCAKQIAESLELISDALKGA
ncbi:MAG: hypothetical protein IPK58_09935 [Acidobacteria bacterium]|nr:hypothetical protein [Acidobacteriota bacterium]